MKPGTLIKFEGSWIPNDYWYAVIVKYNSKHYPFSDSVYSTIKYWHPEDRTIVNPAFINSNHIQVMNESDILEAYLSGNGEALDALGRED